MELKVAFGKQVLDVTAPATATVAGLKQLLRPLAGHVLERNMKLICKGKVLAPDAAQLSSFGIGEGAKLMLLAGGSSGPSAPAAKPAAQPRSTQLSAMPAPTADQLSSRIARWAATGVVALRDAGLAVLPEAVIEGCAAATVLDLHRNCFARVPQLSSFARCTRLTLSACGLTEFDCLLLPTSLQVLTLDDNALTTLGTADALNRFTALRQLSVNRNALQQLPDGMSLLALVQLHAAHNQLQSLPASLHTCATLEELRVEHNHLVNVPASLGQLPRLKVLDLDSNRIEAFPPQVLQAPQLHTLSVHDNPVTLEQLRELDGWAAYDARRRSRVDKQLAGGVLGTGGGLDEGSDAVMRRRHGS